MKAQSKEKYDEERGHELMEVIIRPTEHDAALLTARLIADAVRENPHIVLGLATGRTMLRVYDLLADMHRDEELDFSRVATFNLDEYVGIPPESVNSYRYYMNRHLFSRININPKNTSLPNGMADDLDSECRQYEQRIKGRGGIDLQLLGIGRSGHIGFNEPLSAMFSRTRVKSLTPETVEQNAPLFDPPEAMPRRAITMGVGTILESRRCLMLATGAEKAEVLAKAVEGPISAMVSGTALQLHPRCTIIIDEAAASRLTQTEYYRWIFENEPDWDKYRRIE
jgi:glucosamine-6-phosphate deaminase